MFKLKALPYFRDKYLDFTKNNINLKKRIDKTLGFLGNNPLSLSLRSHRVESKNFGRKWSSWVTGDIRIIWDYSENEIRVLNILDLGSHSGKDKVYI